MLLNKKIQKTFLSFVLPYIVFLLMILVIGYVARRISVDIITDQLEEIYAFSINQIDSKIDYNIERITSSVSGLTFSKRISDLANGRGDLTPSEIYLNTDLQIDLVGVLQTSDTITHIGICFVDRGYLLGTSATYREGDLDFWSNLYYGLPFSEFQELYLSRYHSGDFYLGGVGTETPYIVYIKTVAVSHLSSSTYLVIKIDPEFLTSSLAAFEQSVESPIYLTVESFPNRTVLSSALKPIFDEEIPEKYDNGRYMVTELALEPLNAKLTIPVPLSIYMDDVNRVSLYILLCTFAFTLIGIVFAGVFSYRSYRPYRRLIELLKVPSASGRSYKQIEDTLTRLIRENRDLSLRLHSSDEQNRIYFLEKLTKGEISKDTVPYSLEYYNIKFSGHVVLALSFAIADVGVNFRDDDVSSGLLPSSVINVFKELIGETEHYFYEADGAISCVTSCSLDEADDHYKSMVTSAQTLEDFFREQLSVHLVTGCSKQQYGIESIWNVYSESLSNLNEALQDGIHGEDHIIKSVIDYINENYSDPMLNSSTTAVYFCYSRSYLSHLFKQCTGIGMMEYIDKLRFEKAKELLVDESHDLSAVAHHSGYLDSRTLNRAFKKYTGMTAGKWRQMYKAGKLEITTAPPV